MSDRAASSKSRARSAAVLAFVAIIVAALGYAIYQEWQQHIISNTATAAAQAEKAKADACIARKEVI